MAAPSSSIEVAAAAAEVRMARFRYLVLTAGFLLGTLVVALTLSDLGVILSIVGATGSTIVSYILPGAIYCSIHMPGNARVAASSSEKTGFEGQNYTLKRRAAFALFIAGCVIIPVALSFIVAGATGH